MYAWPILLPAQTNREDFLKTVSLFDDDIGQAIDVSGRTLAHPGDFTSNNWVLVDGAIVTASATQFTIKDYPIGNQMQALALNVGQNLGILAGDFVTIADAPTRKNSVYGYVTSYAPATGALVCQIGSAFQFEIRGHHHGDGYGSGYGSSSLIGTDSHSAPIISAQLGNGINVVDVGFVQIRIPALTMSKLHHKTYGVAMTLFDGSDTRQVFLGNQPIQFGGVTLMPIATPLTSNPFGLP